jgi:hypothetical protein
MAMQLEEDLFLSPITQSGPHSLTLAQRQQHAKFRKFLQSKGGILPIPDQFKISDDDLIFRFLIAKQWKEDLAFKQLAEYVQWRKDLRVENVFQHPTFHDDVLAATTGYCGVDVEGFPVYWDRPKPEEVLQMLKTQPREELMQYHIAVAEYGRSLQRRHGKDRFVAVLDLKHIGMGVIRNPSVVKLLKEFAHVDQHSYPENMRVMLLLNAPSSFTFVWKVVSGFLEERVRKKMVFLKDLNELSQRIYGGLDGIPVEFGGRLQSGFMRMRDMLELARQPGHFGFLVDGHRAESVPIREVESRSLPVDALGGPSVEDSGGTTAPPLETAATSDRIEGNVSLSVAPGESRLDVEGSVPQHPPSAAEVHVPSATGAAAQESQAAPEPAAPEPGEENPLATPAVRLPEAPHEPVVGHPVSTPTPAPVVPDRVATPPPPLGPAVPPHDPTLPRVLQFRRFQHHSSHDIPAHSDRFVRSRNRPLPLLCRSLVRLDTTGNNDAYNQRESRNPQLRWDGLLFLHVTRDGRLVLTPMEGKRSILALSLEREVDRCWCKVVRQPTHDPSDSHTRDSSSSSPLDGDKIPPPSYHFELYLSTKFGALLLRQHEGILSLTSSQSCGGGLEELVRWVWDEFPHTRPRRAGEDDGEGENHHYSPAPSKRPLPQGAGIGHSAPSMAEEDEVEALTANSIVHKWPRSVLVVQQ